MNHGDRDDHDSSMTIMNHDDEDDEDDNDLKLNSASGAWPQLYRGSLQVMM